MSFPTRVLENGEWVTRYQDAYDLLRRNRDSETQQVEAPKEIPKPPSLGVISRTLTGSSIVKWIIPARVRHADKNDVLYITADSVEIREAKSNYTMQHVAVKNDFGSSIRAAKICGRQRLPTKPDIRAIIKEEPPENENAVMTGDMDEDSEPKRPTLLTGKQKALSRIFAAGPTDGLRETELFYTKELSTRCLPPHFLVLTLSSGRLVFVYTISGASDQVQWVSVQVPLLNNGPHLEELGEQIAVDPRSRALAVAAHEGIFYIYRLKSMDDLERQVKLDSKLSPVLSERSIRIKGVILKIEFLYPPMNDVNHVILLLVVSKNGRSSLVLYEWDSSLELDRNKFNPKSFPLASEEKLPLLLIPVLYNSAFLLVCERQTKLYKDLLTGSPKCHGPFMTDSPEIKEPGLSKRSPVWVQWARVLRHTMPYQATEDGIFLCREDGIVHFLQIKAELPGLVDSRHVVDRLCTKVDSAFAVIDVGPQKHDLLAVEGDGSEGGLWCFEARELGQRISKSLNFAPIVDTTSWQPLSPRSSEPLIQALHGQTRLRRIFACTGKGIHGALTEIRFGITAKKHLTVEFSDNLGSEVLALWALHHPRQLITYVFLTVPKKTQILIIEPDQDDSSNLHCVLVDDHPDLDLQSRTIAARITSQGRIIQITEHNIRAVDTLESTENGPRAALKHYFGFSRVVLATIGTSEMENLVLVAFKESDVYRLGLGIAEENFSALADPTDLPSSPSALAMMNYEGRLLALVGCSDQAVRVYSAPRPGEQLEIIAEYSYQGEFAVCESIAFYKEDLDPVGNHSSPRVIIACGLRNGNVSLLSLTNADSMIRLLESGCYCFGVTPVQVLSGPPNSWTFVIHCADVFCGLQLDSNGVEHAPATTHQIWIVDEGKPNWQQERFSALALSCNEVGPQAENGEPHANILVGIDRNAIHVASIDPSMKVGNVPRNVNLGITPSRMIYSSHLQRLLVLGHDIFITKAKRVVGNQIQPGTRAFRPVIKIIEPLLTEEERTTNPLSGSSSISNDDQNIEIDCKPGERFLGITEWCPVIGSEEGQMLVVNTSIQGDASKAASGRLLIFAILHKDGRFRFPLRKEIYNSSPITAVATYPADNTIIYCCGNDLCGFSMKSIPESPQRMRLEHFPKVALRSPGRHISVRIEDHVIFVSTADESVSAFRLRNHEFVYRFSDTIGRQGIYHLQVPGEPLLLASDASQSVACLWTPPHEPIDNVMKPVFEAANLPHSIVRLLELNSCSWYSQPRHWNKVVQEAMSHTHQRFLGLSTSGAMTQFLILPSHQWPFLIFLQAFLRRCPYFNPFPTPDNYSPPFSFFNTYIENPQATASKTHATDLHVDGDLLSRIIPRFAGDALTNILWFGSERGVVLDKMGQRQQIENPGPSSGDIEFFREFRAQLEDEHPSTIYRGRSDDGSLDKFGTRDERLKMFAQLARPILGQMSSLGTKDVGSTNDESHPALREYVGFVQAWVAWLLKAHL